MNIEDLPDYPLIKKLAEALWRNDKSYQGAAIMIGSGFSRSAACSGDINRQLPLWSDLLATMVDELGYDPKKYYDPLRIAEEYDSYFGRQALKELIERTVSDDAWTPGELYKSLMELPWSEILTTNWDTLLERAASTIYKPVYSIVYKPKDLTSAYSPRIVKLHGTIKITDNLIFTQEDYRKYPYTHAAFVNLARQIFIENEFCLLGFSGDDPNFLQWIGWVRDQLANHSRRIYLVGAFSLTGPKRNYLESINVAPIDLSNIVSHINNSDEKHRKATEIFIRTLQELKPKNSWDWEPTSIARQSIPTNEIDKVHEDMDFAASLLESKIEQLIQERESYPRWLVCPPRLLFGVQNQIMPPHPSAKNLAAMNPVSRAKILYEIAWRGLVTFSMNEIFLHEELLKACNLSENNGLSVSQKIDIALWLYQSSHWYEESEEYINVHKKAEKILDEASKESSEVQNQINYHKAIIARENFDYPELEEVIENIEVINPEWGMKKASLLAELGKFEQAESLLKNAYKELKLQSRNEPESIYVLSCLAWVSFLLQGADFFNRDRLETKPFDFKYIHSNPWDYLEYIRRRLSETLEKQMSKSSIEPSFVPGHYIDHSKSLSFSNEIHPVLLVEGVVNTVGIPIRWKDCNLIVDIFDKLTQIDNIEDRRRFYYAIRASNSDTSKIFKSTFSRINIAKLESEDAAYLLDKTYEASKYWWDKYTYNDNNELCSFSVVRLSVFLEALARLVTRASPEKSIEIFRWGCDIAKKREISHILLLDSFRNLINFSLATIPVERHSEIFVDALMFPLSTEKYIHNSDAQRWPNPTIEIITDRYDNYKITSRINEIIENISNNDKRSYESIIRLLPLIKSNYLNHNEFKSLEEKLWRGYEDYKNIPNFGVYPHVLLKLPNNDRNTLERTIKKYVFGGNEYLDSIRLKSIRGVIYETGLTPSKKQTIKIFNQLTSWRFSENTSELAKNLSSSFEESFSIEIGYTLNALLSSKKQVLNKFNFTKLLDFYYITKTHEALCSFIYFSKKTNKASSILKKEIKEGFYTTEVRKLTSSCHALLDWCKFNFNDELKPLITKLVYSINPNGTEGLALLINTANDLYTLGYLSQENISTLREIIPIIFDVTDYKNLDPSSRLAVSVTLAREACVKLSRELLKENSDPELHRIIEKAQLDPLPEVRFA